MPWVKIQVPLIDLSNSSASDRESKVAEWLEGEIKQPFTLSQAPLWRAYILKLEEKWHRFVLTIHPIISDGLSRKLILKELATFYSAQSEGKTCQLKQPMQFREYLEWQNQIIQTREMVATESYGLDKFSDSISIIDLPTDRPPNSSDIYEHPQLSTLRKTQQWGCRLGDGSLEWRGNIHRLVKIKGNRINLQEIEATLRSHPEVKDCHVLVRDRQLVAYLEVSKAISTESIHTQIKPQLPNHQQPDAYVQVSALPLTASGKIDENTLATLEVIDSQLIRRWEEKLHSHPQIEQAAVVVQPKQAKAPPPVHVLDLIPEATPTVKFSATTAKVPSEVEVASQSENQTTVVPAFSDGGKLLIPENAPQTLAEALQRAAKQHSEPGIKYINFDGSESTQSYADLLKNAQIILAGLREIGLKPQDKVIFQLPQNQDFISAFWGCILGGFIPVPVSIARSYDQPNTTLSKLQNSWQMLGKPLVLTDRQLAPKLQNWSQELNLEDGTLETIESLQNCEPDGDFYNSNPEDLALLLLTSGSTGMPKAVMQTHCSLLSRSAATAQMNNFTSKEISLNWFPLDHVGGIVMFHLRDVYLGCQQIQAPTEMVLQAPTKWLDWISQYGVTITWAPNFAYGLVLEQIENLSKQGEIVESKWNLSSLKFILNAGEAIVAKTTRRFLELLLISSQLPAHAMHPAWGMSETSSAVTFSDKFLLALTTDEQKFVEVGAPTPGTKIRITDNQNQVVAEGKIGSVQIQECQLHLVTIKIQWQLKTLLQKIVGLIQGI